MYDFMLKEEELALKHKARAFVKNEIESDFLRDMDKDIIRYPKEFVKKLAKHKLLGIRFPKEYGGQSMSWVAEVAVLEEIGCLGVALGCAMAMPSIVGEAITYFGSEYQKQKYLKPCLEGKLISAEALTEPRGGSDFFGAMTRADLKDSYFVLNGAKRFVVGAEAADFFLVYCRTNFDKNAAKHNRLSLIIVDKNEVEVKYLYGLMGCRGGGTGRIVFNNARVPIENLVGELHYGSIYFNKMMIPERLTSAAAALGVWGSLDVAVRYSEKRRAFGKKIRSYQGVNFKIADTITKLDSARAMVYMAANSIDKKDRRTRRLVSEAKKVATETAWEIVNEAMQIMGGIGYTSIYPIERALRDNRLCMLWTGTNEIMNLLIQHEYYHEILDVSYDRRKMENDALNPDESERCYTDDDMHCFVNTSAK